MQVSTRDADWILDPLAVDLKPLGPLLSNPAIEKIFHASEYDVTSLKRDYGFTFRNLFDTLVAAKAIGRKKLGLGNLVEEVLGVKLTKDEQRSDWGGRPLSADQIDVRVRRYPLPAAALGRPQARGAGQGAGDRRRSGHRLPADDGEGEPRRARSIRRRSRSTRAHGRWIR